MDIQIVLFIVGIILAVYGILGRKIKGVEVKGYKLFTEPLDPWQRLVLAALGVVFIVIAILPILGILQLLPRATPVTNTVTPSATSTPPPTFTPAPTSTPTPTPTPIIMPTVMPSPTLTQPPALAPTPACSKITAFRITSPEGPEKADKPDDLPQVPRDTRISWEPVYCPMTIHFMQNQVLAHLPYESIDSGTIDAKDIQPGWTEIKIWVPGATEPSDSVHVVFLQ